MEQWYPHAARKPLGPQTEPVIGTPRVFIVHTMVGFLRGTDTMFRRNGYTGTESTFGLGGPWDGSALDGVVWQWQELGRQADAQGSGNRYATSVETSDGGVAVRPWSPAQVRGLILLGAWWARATGNPVRLVTSPDGRGFGYHRQFSEWNPNNHSCPGDTRLEQYVQDVIPGIVRYLNPSGAPYVLRRTLRLGMSGEDVKRVQDLVGCRQDGDYGPITVEHVKDWQASKRLAADGIFGPKSAAAAGWLYRG
jgi:hypothetical protein